MTKILVNESIRVKSCVRKGERQTGLMTTEVL